MKKKRVGDKILVCPDPEDPFFYNIWCDRGSGGCDPGSRNPDDAE